MVRMDFLHLYHRVMAACAGCERNVYDEFSAQGPQVTEQLRVIATSPAVVIGISCFRKGFSPTVKQKILDTAMVSQQEPSFRQVMALFKGGPIVEGPLSLLESTRALIARYRQVLSEASQAKGPAARAPATPAAASQGKTGRRNGT